VTFCNWCGRTHRLTTNPFKDVSRVDQESDPRRRRRAMTEDELTRLLEITAQSAMRYSDPKLTARD
jgi:hypothetical protein